MRKFKIMNTLILIILVTLNIFLIGKNIIAFEYTKLLYNGLLFLSLSFPFFVKKIVKIDLNELFKFLYYIYIIISVVLGEIIGLNKTTLWYDKIVHFYYGFMLALSAILFIKYNKKDLKKKILFNILFISGFTLLFADIWEFVEFTTDKIFNTDHQRWREMGIDDTMYDLLVAFLGSIIINISYYIEVKKNKLGLVFNSIKDDNKKDT